MQTNTGYKAYTKLFEKIVGTSTFTGAEKANINSDPDYVEPVQDTTTCPISSQNPNQFAFTDLANQNLSSLIESDQITITGLISNTTVTVTNGAELNINNSEWETSNGLIQNNDLLKIRNTSSSIYGTNKSTTITIGSINDTWVIGTKQQTAWRVLESSGVCVTDNNDNTGYKSYSTLEQFYTVTTDLTGTQKPNINSDPDYISPIVNLTECPINQSVANVKLSVYGADPQIGSYNSYGFMLESEMLLDEDIIVNFDGYYEHHQQGSIYYQASLTLYRNTLTTDSTLIINNASAAGSNPTLSITTTTPTNESSVLSNSTGKIVTLNVYVTTEGSNYVDAGYVDNNYTY